MVTEAVLLDNAAFSRMVTEEKLQTTELGGYVYTGKRGKHGWEVYRTYGPKWAWLYTARYVLTQDNAGGGALALRFTVASGTAARLVTLAVTGSASAGATLSIILQDEDGATHSSLGYSVAGASRFLQLPSVGTASNAHGNYPHTLNLIVGPGQSVVMTTSAALQTETLTVAVGLILPISAATDGSDVSWATTGSAGTPNLGDNTISEVNRMQAVLLP